MTQIVALAILLLLAVPARGGEVADADAVAACVQRNLPETTSVQTFRFRTSDRAGSEREITGKVWWRRFEKGRSRVLLGVQKPADLRGSALLLIERSSGSDMFLYLPELRKTRRITSRAVSGSLFGSDFTYEDFQQIQGISLGGESQALPDATLDGVPVHVIAQRPAPGTGSSYERVVSYVTRDGCVPIRCEMWEPGERLRKLLTADLSKLYEQNGVRIPTHLRMEDQLSRSSTDLVLSDIEVGGEIPRRYFEMATLERLRLD
jgi:hypothetical protein